MKSLLREFLLFAWQKFREQRGTSCTAAWNQVAFRFRNDNGNETTATWRQDQNANDSQLLDTNYRVRFEIQETAACAANNKTWQFQYNLNNTGWVNVTGTSNVVRASASPNLADAANLTDQLTAGTGTFMGLTGFDEANGAAGGGSMDVVASGHAEAEFCYQIRSADVVNGNTVWLRATDNGTQFAAYGGGTATVTAIGALRISETTLNDAPTATDVIVDLQRIAQIQNITIGEATANEAPTATENLRLSSVATFTTDTSAVTDAVVDAQLKVTIITNQAESPTVTDDATPLLPWLAPVLSDSPIVEEVVNLLLAQLTPAISDDAFATDDATPLFPFLAIFEFDNPVSTDALVQLDLPVAAAPTPSVFDSPTVTEAIEFNTAVTFDTDTPTATDSLVDLQLAMVSALTASVGDDLTIIEQVEGELLATVSDGELATVTDAIVEIVLTQISPVSIEVNDASTSTDVLFAFTTVSSIFVYDDSPTADAIVDLLISAAAPVSVSDVNDAPTASDAIAIAGSMSVSFSDQPVVSEQETILLPILTAEVADAPTATDFHDIVATAGMAPSASDSPTATDTLIQIFLDRLFTDQFDNPTITDSLSIASVFPHISIFDNATVTEWTDQQIPILFISLFDVTSVADGITVSSGGLAASVFDEPIADELTALTWRYDLDLSDSPIASDYAAIFQPVLSLEKFDSPFATDIKDILIGRALTGRRFMSGEPFLYENIISIPYPIETVTGEPSVSDE